MIEIERLQETFRQAMERAIKIHEALEIPYITSHHGQVVEMLHGEVVRVIEPNRFGNDRASSS
jgi:hypothetical protein